MAPDDFPSPMVTFADQREVLIGYLDFFRDVVRRKVAAMSPEDQATSILPSGWTPLELLNHLRHVERRWLEWGFLGAPTHDPWADQVDGRWHTDEDVDVLSRRLDTQAAVTREVIRSHDLADVGAPGDRWEGAAPPPLYRVLLHLVQEYARHCGQLDIVVELVNGSTGETVT